jgi:hypothetical protein
MTNFANPLAEAAPVAATGDETKSPVKIDTTDNKVIVTKEL